MNGRRRPMRSWFPSVPGGRRETAFGRFGVVLEGGPECQRAKSLRRALPGGRATPSLLLPAAALSLASMALAAAAAAAPPPNLVDMHPHGGQQGRALRLVIEGYGLPGEMEIESTLPGSFARLGEASDEDRLQKRRRPNDRNLQAAVFLVEIDAGAAPGLYPLRAVTEDGLSNALLFRVDTLPEVSERDLRDGDGAAPRPAAEGARDAYRSDAGGAADASRPAPGSARATSRPAAGGAADAPLVEELPVVVNGTLDGAERDRYRFQAACRANGSSWKSRRAASARRSIRRFGCSTATAARSPSTRRDPASTPTPASTGSRRRQGSTWSKSTTPASATSGGTSTASS